MTPRKNRRLECMACGGTVTECYCDVVDEHGERPSDVELEIADADRRADLENDSFGDSFGGSQRYEAYAESPMLEGALLRHQTY